MGAGRSRRLLIGDEVYRWRVGHRHARGTDETGSPGYDCAETLAIWREGERGKIRFVFENGPGRLVPDGSLHSGAVLRLTGQGRPDTYLNLNRPGTVRALLDEALACGATFDAPVDLDGWNLIHLVAARLGPT
ncbi:MULTISPECIES: hypothetical protein [Actinomadura]|uniref:Uncharacterized protein n=1 Tax=Actinomadura yumaensis TaxID=111807 RepID=A0ABW2CJD2_9ACTN|nr:hypothetical protein [Actinomadura sp. J1-007]MWK39859.1 hypothetical protein [Actinomadura sp. J1-007]